MRCVVLVVPPGLGERCCDVAVAARESERATASSPSPPLARFPFVSLLASLHSMELLDLPGWADEPAPPAPSGWPGGPTCARQPGARFAPPRPASVASTTFSLLSEEGACASSEPGDDAGVEWERVLSRASSDEDDGADGGSQGSEDSSEDLPELSFSSASEPISRSPSPVPPTPSPLNLDAFDEQLLPFSRPASPGSKDADGLHTTGDTDAPGAMLDPVRSLPHRLPSLAALPPRKRTRSSSPPQKAQPSSVGRARPSPERAELVRRPPSPTQAEMDAFFGFVDPHAEPPRLPEGRVEAHLSLEVDRDPVRTAEGGVVDEEEASLAETGTREPVFLERATDKAMVTEELDVWHKDSEEPVGAEPRYFQLAPLPKVSLETGLPLSTEERRSAPHPLSATLVSRGR